MRTVAVPFLLVLLAAGGAWAKGDDSIQSEVSILSSSCLTLLDQVLDSYRLAVEPYEANGCNTTCLAHCEKVVQDGIYAKYHEDCPLQSELTYCFNVSVGYGVLDFSLLPCLCEHSLSWRAPLVVAGVLLRSL